MNIIIFTVCIGAWSCSPVAEFIPVDNSAQAAVQARNLCDEYVTAIKEVVRGATCVARIEEIKK